MDSRVFIVLALTVVFCMNVIVVQILPFKQLVRESRVYVAPTRAIKNITLGYSDIVADTLWLRVIQDYGLCEQKNSTDGKSRIDPTRTFDCNKGWVYKMLDVITHLAPRFRMPYATGATILSVIVDDIAGASLLFEKAVLRFPKDWSINYRAAYHFLFEEGDKVKAAKYLLVAAQNGGPIWLHSLSAKLYSESGQALFGKLVLEDYLKKHGDHYGRKRIEERLAQINAVLRKEEKLLLQPNQRTKSQ